MTQFNITSPEFNIPPDATRVTATIRLTKENEPDIVKTATVNVSPARLPSETSLPRMYMCSPRLEGQEIDSGGRRLNFREEFDRQSGIPSDRTGYAYWMLESKSWWPENGAYIPQSSEELNRLLFDGLLNENGDFEEKSTSWVARLFRFHDEQIFDLGHCNPEEDILVFDFEIRALFYTLQTDMLYRYRFDSYDENGNVDPDGIHRPPFNEDGTGIYYQINPIYTQPERDFNRIHFTIINAYKRIAAMCRRRYGFKTVGNYGIGGFNGWWHGLRSRSLGLEGETVFDDDRITSINPNFTYRKWMKWSWRRILQRWEDYGLFTESSPGEGDYLDKIVCLPKQDKWTTVWGWPYSEDRGFDEVVKEHIDAFTPWKDKTLLLVNNYYSVNRLDCSGPSQWDQAHRRLFPEPSRPEDNAVNITSPINVNYRSATETPPKNTNVNSVTAPAKLSKELDRVLPIFFKYAPDWDILDFNGMWVDYDRWPQYSSETDPNVLQNRTGYWLAGYDGNYENDDKYNFIFQNMWIPWYQKLWSAYPASTLSPTLSDEIVNQVRTP